MLTGDLALALAAQFIRRPSRSAQVFIVLKRTENRFLLYGYYILNCLINPAGAVPLGLNSSASLALFWRGTSQCCLGILLCDRGRAEPPASVTGAVAFPG